MRLRLNAPDTSQRGNLASEALVGLWRGVGPSAVLGGVTIHTQVRGGGPPAQLELACAREAAGARYRTVAQLRALAADESEDAFDAVGVGNGSPVRSNRRRGVIGVRAVGRRLREQRKTMMAIA